MKKSIGFIMPFTLLLGIPLINIIYVYLNNSQRGIHTLVTDLDRSIPFVKAFAIPYLLWSPYLFLTLVFLCLRYREIYYRVIASLLISLMLFFIIYYFFQTTVPRPNLSGNDLLTNLVRYVYKTDNPFNCFPSIHCLTSYLLIKGINRCSSKLTTAKIIVITTSILIILSTQFIKQHVLLDLIFAIIIGNIIFKAVDYLSSEINLKCSVKSLRLPLLKNKVQV